MTDVRHERYAKSISRLPTAVPTNNIGPQSQSVKDHMTKIIKSDAQKAPSNSNVYLGQVQQLRCTTENLT